MLGPMRALAQDVLEAPPAVRAIRVEHIERRLLRYSVQFGGDRAPWSVIGKIYENESEGQRAFDGLRGLWDGGFPQQPPADIQIPRPYAYLTALRLVLMEEVPGTALKKLVRQRLAGPAEMQLFAAGLAKLHRSALAPGKPFRVDDHLEIRCAGLHEAMADAFPDIRARVRWMVERARELEAGQEPPRTAVHGDFHLGQVHVRGGELWILDLDPLHFGDPAYDVAMVFVMLKHLEQKMRDPAYIRMLCDGFIAAYGALNGYEAAARVPLHIALIHLKRACKRFRYQDEPGWPETIRRQIEEGATCLERMGALATPRSASDVVDVYARCPVTV